MQGYFIFLYFYFVVFIYLPRFSFCKNADSPRVQILFLYFSNLFRDNLSSAFFGAVTSVVALFYF